MTTTAERLAVLETMVADIHAAVVGDGQHTLVARMAVTETEVSHLKGWRYKGLESLGATLISALVTIVLGTVGIHLPGRTS